MSLLTPDIFETHWPLTRVSLKGSLPGFAGCKLGVLESDQGTFVYKLGNYANMQRSSDLLQFLEERSFNSAPRLLSTRTNEIARIDDNGLMVMEHVDGNRPEPTFTNYGLLGDIMRQLHQIQGFSTPCPITLKMVKPELYQNADKLSGSDRAQYEAVVSALPDLDSLPQSLIHFEMSLKNTIQRPNGTYCRH